MNTKIKSTNNMDNELVNDIYYIVNMDYPNQKFRFDRTTEIIRKIHPLWTEYEIVEKDIDTYIHNFYCTDEKYRKVWKLLTSLQKVIIE